ncbi:MAG: ROK family protein [bacterium]|jgi:glucokinase
MAQYAIGVDLGGTNLRAAAISSTGKILEKVVGTTNLCAGRDAVVADIVSSIVALRERHGPDLVGIGVGTPGIIELETGVLKQSPNLPAFDNFPMRDELERLLQAPVLLENDANAAALGEKWMGAGRDVQDLVLLTLGTGVGGGIVCGGHVMRGFMGMAGEIGHMTVVPNGNPCGCGNSGCLEKHASATSVIAHARMLGLRVDSAKDVYDLALAGEPKARRVFEVFGSALGVALANLVNLFNFPLYLLSGGVLGAWDFFAPAMLEEVRKRSFVYRAAETRIDKAILGNESGLYGAAYLPVQARIVTADVNTA